MKKIMLVMLVLLAGGIVFAGFYLNTFSSESYSIEGAEEVVLSEEPEELGMEGLAKFISEIKAHNFHDTKKLMSVEVLYSIEDDELPVAYSYIYYLDNDSVFDVDRHVLVAKEFSDVREKMKNAPSGSKEYEDFRVEFKALEKELRMRDEFVTIIISANKSRGPVLDRYFGLSHSFYKRTTTVFLHDLKDGDSSKTYYVDNFNLFFELDNGKYVSLSSLEAVSLSDVMDIAPVFNNFDEREWKLYQSVFAGRQEYISGA